MNVQISGKNRLDQFMQLFRSPFFTYLLGLGIGAAVVLFWLGRPEWWRYVWTPETAGWASAIGTFLAVAAALWIAQLGSRNDTVEAKQRAAAAATVISTNLFQARALVDTIERYKSELLANAAGYAPWATTLSQSIPKYGPIIQDKYSSWLLHLPTSDLHLLVLADEAFEDLKERVPHGPLLVTPVITLEVVKHISEISLIVISAADAMYKVMGTRSPPPWKTYSEQMSAPNENG